MTASEGPREAGENWTWKLLKLVSVASADRLSFEAAAQIIHERAFNVDELVGCAARQGLISVLADFLVEADLSTRIPDASMKHLSESLAYNQLRTAAFLTTATEIASAAKAAGVGLTFTKGIICQQTLYGGSGARSFGDIDVMIAPADAPAITGVLERLGFTNRRSYMAFSGTWRSLTTEERAAYRLYPDHLPHFYRVSPNGVPRSHCVDVAFDLTWYSSPWKVPHADALASARMVHTCSAGVEVDLPALGADYDFLFHVLHLFREAWFERTAGVKDVRLSQFADVWRGWHGLNEEMRHDIAQIVSGSSIEPPVAWVCHHLDQIYRSSTVSALGLEDYCTSEWVRSGRARRGYFLWNGDMERRLRSIDFQRDGVETVPFTEE